MPDKTEPESARLRKLEEAVNVMDAMSQEGFSKISAISKLALKAMEAPGGWCDLDGLAGTLETIHSIARDIENSINSEAEQVGCNYRDEAIERRYAARRASEHQV